MKPVVLLVLLAIALPAWWRESNSHHEASRGAGAWQASKHADAARAYSSAHAIDPSVTNAFNAGTASIAAGLHAEGAAQLEPALRDPALKADAYYNRGNGALAAKAFDHAVRDYIEALRANPRHAAAKRNLEIALQRKQEQEKEDAAKGQQGKNDGKQQPTPAPGEGQQKGELDLEALLRSVQQQEQEELRRLKGEAAEGKVGW
jgi:tetratricopeptide (TPR) repeat protein